MSLFEIIQVPIRSAIIQDIEGMHAAGLATMAYYYFDFRDVKKQDCYGLLSSLVLQLSAESDSCFNTLSRFYSDHSRGIRKPVIDALKKCMTDMLCQPGQAPTYKLKSVPPARAFASSHPTYGNGLELVGGSTPKPPAYPLGFIFYYHFVTYK